MADKLNNDSAAVAAQQEAQKKTNEAIDTGKKISNQETVVSAAETLCRDKSREISTLETSIREANEIYNAQYEQVANIPALQGKVTELQSTYDQLVQQRESKINTSDLKYINIKIKNGSELTPYEQSIWNKEVLPLDKKISSTEQLLTEAQDSLNTAEMIRDSGNLVAQREHISEKERALASAKEQKVELDKKVTDAKTELENLKKEQGQQKSDAEQAQEVANNTETLDTLSNELVSMPELSKLGLDKTKDISKLAADGSGTDKKIDEYVAASDNESSNDAYYAKDISSGSDGSELAVVKVSKDKETDATKQALKDKGFEKLDKDSTLAGKFKEKELIAAREKENAPTGRAIEDSQPDQNGNGSNGNDENKPIPEKPYSEKEKAINKELEGYQNEDWVIAGHKVQYVKVTGNNKIRYPIYEKVMGLPPLRIFEDPEKGTNTTDIFNVNIDSDDTKAIKMAKEYFLYNVDEQLVNSFPILTIKPLDNENVYGTNKLLSENGKVRARTDAEYKDKMKTRYNVVDGVVYKFAVTTQNSLSYSHQNTFSQSSTENTLSEFEKVGDIAREVNGLIQGSYGYGHNNLMGAIANAASHMGSEGQNAYQEIMKAIAGSVEEGSNKEVANTFTSVLNLAQDVISGGRVDFADVWQNSQTAFQQSFTIELRTLNPDPSSEQYFKELLLPLYILLTLSLPTQGSVFAYKTPPLITCSLDDSFMEIIYGAITQINWTFDMKEINFKKVPWHCQVNITIRDLYSVMPQETYTMKNGKYVSDENKNREVMTKDRYINNFIKTKDKKVPNEKYYLTEFAKIPAYMNALERKMNDEQKAAEEKKKDDGPNAKNKSGSQQQNGKVAGNSAETGKDTSKAPKREEIKTDKKTGKKTLISSIGGFVTGVTKGIRHVVSEVNKAITPVRQIINTGATVLNAANNVKCAIKCVGETANLPGLLNGSFAASVGLCFENLGKAGNVLNGLSGGVLGSVTKSVGGICTTLSEMGRSALVLDLPEYVSKDGKTIQVNDPFKVASSTVRATGLMVSNILNTVQGAKMIGDITKSSDPLATLTTYVNAANKIVGEVDFTDKLFNAAKGSAIATGQYTAGQLASNATIQERFRYVANTVSANAASIASTMFNTTLAEYMIQQEWFKTYFQTINNNTDPSNPISILNDFKYKDEIKEAIDYANGKTTSITTPKVTWSAVKDSVMDNIDGSIQSFSKGAEEFFNTCGDMLIKSGFSGLVNTSGTPFDVIFTDNK